MADSYLDCLPLSLLFVLFGFSITVARRRGAIPAAVKLFPIKFGKAIDNKTWNCHNWYNKTWKGGLAMKTEDILLAAQKEKNRGKEF